MDTELFFDKYEEDVLIRPAIDSLCMKCPVNKKCFAAAVSKGQNRRDQWKTWGVFGGIYFKDGVIDKEFNNHKTKDDWYNIWESLTIERS